MSEVLEVINVSKRFNTQTVLEKINLSLCTGSTYGLIGLNGAGKTTLIKCILDLHRADEGTIIIQGTLSHYNRARQNLIYLPEKFSPPDYMNGWTYLHFIKDAYNQKYENKAWQQRINSLCKEIDFDSDALKKSIKLYSKGMLQKLGILGCLLSDKSILILDEPMTGLDPKARASFSNIIQRLKEQRKTILLCSHILTDIEKLCDQISILHKGQIRFTGSPQICCKQFGSTDLETAFLKYIEN